MTLTTANTDRAVADLQPRFRGEIVTPDHPAYDAVRRVWNGSIDRYPALIARCTGTADVIAAVRFAREHDLLVAVRGGGHSIPGFSTCDGGLLIDLQPMKGIAVDPVAREAVAQPGLTWAELDMETQAFGLATPGGEVSDTGIAGLTLGGGIGWLRRLHGLTCDNLLSVDLVTADARLVHASADENTDLFWGVRGGGGNFGIVTSFRYRLHIVGPFVGGMVMHPIERGPEVLRFYRQLASAAPDEITLMAAIITAPPAPFVPEDLRGRPAVVLGAAHFGSSQAGASALAELGGFGPPAVNAIRPMGYVELQRLVDEATPRGMQTYVKSEMLTGLTDDVIDAVVRAGRAPSSPMNQILLPQLGGAMSRVPRDETAFVHRQAAFMATIASMWSSPQEADAPHLAWARDLWDAMRTASTGGAYVNHLGREGDARLRQSYGEATYTRLAALKKAWDPDNFFRLNQNIAPAK